MSKIKKFFAIGVVFLLLTGIVALIGFFQGNSSLLALSELFVIASMIFMFWGYVLTLDNIDKNVARNVELMKSLFDTLKEDK